MTGTTRSSSDLDKRRRKILFRCWHRGIREMDIVMGQFADRNIDKLTDDELDTLERILEVDDRDLIRWVTGEIDTPADFDTALFRAICAYERNP
ncbi:succinate dehydrogenase assembly factor 2 [Hoeflea sp. WL0058]|uniref:FAD assembly factor SdhE n=1 Tax=Flavimaribacter sediminis TaxID=2865987 RepID=A0AAE2ZLS3_9HYPH|nr:succinate dehydrogenase assembly factor 2 [Flavimaribacter sediminis]MBW8637020.1 succinate dehydrogenase assembly factor 2 [Flavimaribacter sediminis]